MDERGNHDAGGWDAGSGSTDASPSTDGGSVDARVADGGDGPLDAAPARDAGDPSDAHPSDGGLPDASPTCVNQTPLPAACTPSHAEIEGCELLYDRMELRTRCPERSTLTLTCRGDTPPSYCDPPSECPDETDCIADVWFRFDFGSPRTLNAVRFLAGWWADRPRNYEIWYTADPANEPDDGAMLAFAGTSDTNPWRCVTGEACTAEVPAGCCPDGRDGTQVTDQTDYTPSCDLGTFFPKFNRGTFPAATARYWYFVVRDGVFPDRIFLNEIQFARRCPP